jgi:hypothetical protein
MQTGEVNRISVANDGSQLNSLTQGQAISSNSRFALFAVRDSLGHRQLYERDVQNHTTKLVSADKNGNPSNDGVITTSSNPSKITVTDAGTRVLFRSYSTNLLEGQDSVPYFDDWYIKNTATGDIEQLPIGNPGGLNDSWKISDAKLSADGSTIAATAYDETSETVGSQVLKIPTDSSEPLIISNPSAGSNNRIGMLNLSRNGRFGLMVINPEENPDYPVSNLYKDIVNYQPALRDYRNKSKLLLKDTSNGNLYLINGAIYPYTANVSDDGKYVGAAFQGNNLYGISGNLFIDKVQSGNSVEVTKEIGSSFKTVYAPGARTFSFSTGQNFNDADPAGFDVYTAKSPL